MIWLIMTILAVGFGLGALLGAPYLPLLKREHETLLDLCQLKPGDTLLDLGSGDGRFLKTAATRGYNCIGYEINPVLYLISLIITWPVRDRVSIYLNNFWTQPLPECHTIYVFLINRYMAKLATKLRNEITTPTMVVSYVFAIPLKSPVRTTRNCFVYTYEAGATQDLPTIKPIHKAT